MTDPVTDEATVEIADGEEDFHFTLYYLESVLGEEETEKVFYYQISETTGADEWLDADESKYVVEVTVSRTDAGMSAAVTGVYQDGAKITVADNKVPFTNTLLGSLSLTKTVSGAAQTGIAFNFTLTADGLNGIYGDVTFTDGQATVTLKAEETVTLTGIPAGTVIGISETAPGYQVSYRVNDGDAVYGNETDVIVQAGDTVNVTVNNHSNYELPQTGGTGIHLYTIGGAALMILSLGFLMYMRYSRRRKGANASF